MKLDSEEQRRDLLELLSTVRATVTPATIDAARAEFDRILDPIREAGIEDERPVVPIASLAPDPPGAGMPGDHLKLEAAP